IWRCSKARGGEYPLWISDRRVTPFQWQASATLRAKYSFPLYEMGSGTKRDCLTDPSPGPPESARQISSTCSSKLLEAISSSFRKRAPNCACLDVNFFKSHKDGWFRLCLTHCAALISLNEVASRRNRAAR